MSQERELTGKGASAGAWRSAEEAREAATGGLELSPELGWNINTTRRIMVSLSALLALHRS